MNLISCRNLPMYMDTDLQAALAGTVPRRGAQAPAQGSRTNRTRTLGVANTRVLERFASPFWVVTKDGSVDRAHRGP